MAKINSTYWRGFGANGAGRNAKLCGHFRKQFGKFL